MTRNVLTLLLAAGVLAACDNAGGSSGIDSLGSDFRRAFSQSSNTEPLDADGLRLNLQPAREAFNT